MNKERIYVYMGCGGHIFTSDRELRYEELYCSTCGDCADHLFTINLVNPDIIEAIDYGVGDNLMFKSLIEILIQDLHISKTEIKKQINKLIDEIKIEDVNKEK